MSGTDTGAYIDYSATTRGSQLRERLADGGNMDEGSEVTEKPTTAAEAVEETPRRGLRGLADPHGSESTPPRSEYVDYAAERENQRQARESLPKDAETVEGPGGYYDRTEDIGHRQFGNHEVRNVEPTRQQPEDHEPVHFDPSYPGPMDDDHHLYDHTVPLYGTPTLASKVSTAIFQLISFGITTLSFNILLVLSLGRYAAMRANPFHKSTPAAKIEKAWANRITGERYSTRVEYYAEFWGYKCEAHDVETEDGFVIRLHHLLSPKHRVRGHPVLIQHGILCSSANFVVNEERSMAFWLLEQGYDVWLGNIRTVYKQPHKKFTRSDPRFWAWSFKEIGLYDCTAAISYVHELTGSKVAYIGHSQGAGTMFLALSKGCRPDIGLKMSCFVALAPAVYAGEVLKTFPFSLMRRFTSRTIWSLIFGVRDFMPFMSLLQIYLPGWLFGYFAYPVFWFIFGFDRDNWVPRQIPKMFRTTPITTSSELLFFYLANWSHRGCIFDPTRNEPWFPKAFPPLAIIWGSTDTLVQGAPLVERIRKHEPNVDLYRDICVKNYNHLDLIWAANIIPDVLVPIRQIIEETRAGMLLEVACD